MSHTFAGNNTDVASVCRLVPSLLNNPQLFWVRLDHEPSACVGHDAWKGAGLPAPPDKVVDKGWIATLSFIRVRVCAPFRKPLRSLFMFHHHAPHTWAAAALTTFADACRHVPRQHAACARRRIRSCRVRALPRACSCCAAACAPGDHDVAALACASVAAGQGLPGQGAAAAAVPRRPSVCPVASPGHCCRAQRSPQH
jgi:hypothetical protein